MGESGRGVAGPQGRKRVEFFERKVGAGGEGKLVKRVSCSLEGSEVGGNGHIIDSLREI